MDRGNKDILNSTKHFYAYKNAINFIVFKFLFKILQYVHIFLVISYVNLQLLKQKKIKICKRYCSVG